MDSDSEVYSDSSTESSAEVEDFSPPETSGEDALDSGAGPQLYQFVPLAHAVIVEENMVEPEAAWMGDVSEWCGVALDSWMFPLDEEIFPRVKQPIFFINSEKFQWIGNIIRMRKLDSAIIPRKMITIKGTVHQSFPDFTFLTGNWIGRLLKLKGDIDPHIALDLSNKATLAFLQRHLPLARDFNKWDPLIDGKDDNLIPGTNIVIPQSSI